MSPMKYGTESYMSLRQKHSVFMIYYQITRHLLAAYSMFVSVKSKRRGWRERTEK